MTPRVTVHVNGDEVEVRPWATWRDAITAWRPEAGATLSKGSGRVTDPSGAPVDPGGTVVAGGEIRYEEDDER